MKPYQQGNLDGLCGAYAVINAVRLISNKLNTEECQEILLTILRFQIKRRKSVYFMIHGLNRTKITTILKQIIRPGFDITYTTPFSKRQNLYLSELYESLFVYLNGDCKRCAIICFETKSYGHWTVVESITANRLNLFDSMGRHFINRKHCTTTEITPHTPILIDFTATIFLEAK